MKVQISIPCFVDQLYPQTAFNMIKVLEKAGCDVDYNPNQTCCGQPAFNAGFQAEAKKVAAKFINDFDTTDFVVAPSASCVGFVRNYYAELFANSSQHNLVKNLSSRIFEFTEFLTQILKVDHFGASFSSKVTYHDSCAGLRECKIKQGPRQLLQNVSGLELIEMAETDACCGFGGTFAVKFDDISYAMAEQKLQHASDSGANCIVSTDLSCLMHLQGVIDKKSLPLTTMHIADVLASGW
jgi:L-lactate dehydrogenase complex protein LldE